MTLIGRVVHHRTTVFFLTAALTIAGIQAYRSLPLEAAPDISIPNVFISTSYRGASPADIEKSITIPIEDELQGLPGVEEITSVSSEGDSFINVEFATGVDIDDALIKVKDRVDRANQDLPKDLEDDPFVQEINFSEMPVLVLTLSGESGMRQLTTIAEDLADELETIPGVLEVEVSGGVRREIQVQLYPDKLALYQIPMSRIEALVTRSNQNTSGGFFRTSEGRYQIRVPGEFADAAELEGLVVDTRSGAPIYLRDIGKIVDGLRDRESRARANGRESVNLAVKKRVGENIIRIVDAVDEVVARAQPGWPAGTEAHRVMDAAKDVRAMLADLENNLLSGLLLVVIVVSLAMGPRNGILVTANIPLSMLITFIVLQALGITLNMVVLFSLTLAVGMLVDNAIVINENCYRFMQQGVPRLDAVVAATGEVAWPIAGSALTTIGAFLPLLAWEGVMGSFMIFLPETVIITLASCLFVALVLNPALAAAFLRVRPPRVQRSAVEVLTSGEHPMLTGGGRVAHAYRRVLRLALRFRLAVVALAGATTIITAMCWFLAVGMRTPTEFFPSIDPDSAYVNVNMPEGVDLDFADTLLRKIAARVFSGAENATYAEAIAPKVHARPHSGQRYEGPSDLANVDYIYEKAGSSGGAMASFFGAGSANQVGLQFVPIEERDQPSRATLAVIEERVRGVAGAEILVEEQRHGPPTGAPISIEITGDDFAILGRIAEQIKAVVQRVPFVRNVRDDFEQGMPTIRVHVDRKRAGLLGLSIGDVGTVLKSAFNGVNVSTYRDGNDEYDIVVRLVEEDRRAIETLSRVSLATPEGTLVPLTTLCDIDYVGGVGRITRVDRKRVVTVSADVDTAKTTGVTARSAAERLLAGDIPDELAGADTKALAGFALPPGYRYRFTGEREEEQKSQEFLSWAMGVALLVILTILVAQFNSVLYPLIIMSSVILSLSGVFVGLLVHGMPFGIIMTGVGVISLAGVVVNNAIVLLSYTVQLRRRGLSLDDALVAAGATRLRPVLLTAITTILGLVPMVTGVSYDFSSMAIQWVSSSSQWWKSMAVAVIYGLGLATMLTLVVVPVLFSLVDGFSRSGARAGAWAAAGKRVLVRWWWRPFDRMFGTRYAESKSRGRWSRH
ncbi:MAG: efflux RND transporter permease subunit [Candidatus Schekmanbacteria bacterium]|nr:efflux RND transporter permease subunit [Candidatus Schekmanbacteria bacterium]